MTDDQDQLAKQLERATSAEISAMESLDDESSALREGWLALGQLLEADRKHHGEPLRLGPPARRPKQRYLMAMIAAAASLLIGAGITWSLISTNRQPESTARSVTKDPAARSSADPAKEVGDPETPGTVLVPRETLRRPERKAVASGSWDWGDSLDEEIAQAGQAMVAVQQDWRHLEDTFEPVYHRLEAMEEDMNDSTL